MRRTPSASPAGDRPPTFGYSATLASAARTRHTLGAYLQLPLGLVVGTPHKRVDQAAITVLNGIVQPQGESPQSWLIIPAVEKTGSPQRGQ